MSKSDIEAFIYQHTDKVHWVTHIECLKNSLVLSLTTHPERLGSEKTIKFNNVIWLNQSIAEDFLNVLQSILGIEQEKLDTDQWRFCLVFNDAEFIFISDWPDKPLHH